MKFFETKWGDRIYRNWYLLAGIAAMLYAPHLSALPESIVHFVGVMFLVCGTANLLIHGFTSIAWRDWSGNDEFEKLGKSLVMAVIFFACAYVAGQMFQGEHATQQVQQVNEELEQADSLHAIHAVQ